MFKRILTAFVLAVAVFALAACQPAGPTETEGTGYGLVHGHYVGVIVVNVDVDGKVTDLTVEEYFLPYSWAKVSADYAANDDVFTVVGSRGTSYYAKYIKIGDKLFTGEVVGAAAPQGINYKATGIANIETWLENEANSKWYVEQVEANAFSIVTATGATHPTYVKSVADASTNVSMKKSLAGYWVVEAPRLGWAGNVAAFKADLIGKDLTVPFTWSRDAAAAAGSQFWTINGVVSGATWSDYPDYLDLAIRAYRNRA